jgi:hypothetical protein
MAEIIDFFRRETQDAGQWQGDTGTSSGTDQFLKLIQNPFKSAVSCASITVILW